MKNFGFFLFFCALVALFYLPLHFEELLDEEEEEKSSWLILSEEQIEDGGIAFSEIETQTIEKILPVYGKVSLIPDNQSHIPSKISGFIIAAFKNIGDSVRQGETLALIESRELVEAQAQYQALTAKIALLQSEYNKEVSLSEKRLATEYELLRSLTDLKQAEFEQKIIAEKMQTFGLSPEMNPIWKVKAPFDGTIIKRNITMGDAITSGQELYELANLDQVWGEFVAYPFDFHFIDLDKEIVIQNGTGELAKCTINYISPIVNDDKSVTFIAKIENPEKKWRPGSNITGNVLAYSYETECCVPTEAVVWIDSTPYIFVVHDEGIEPRKVYLGDKNDYYTEIAFGALDGEVVVTTNAALLKCEMTKQEP